MHDAGHMTNRKQLVAQDMQHDTGILLNGCSLHIQHTHVLHHMYGVILPED